MQDPQARSGAAVATARRLVLAAVLVGFGLRLAFAFGYWIDRPLTHDEREYLELAANLAEGRGYRYDAPTPGATPEPRYGRAPIYPAFLAAVRLAAGRDGWLRNVRVAQCLVGALAVWWLALVARRAAGPRAEVACAWLAAVYPPLVWMSAYVLTEGVYVALAALVVLALGPAIDGRPDAARTTRDDLERGAIAGLLAGAGVLVRPAMLFFLALAGLWLLARRRWALLFALAAASLLVVTPWTVRNYREHGRFILVASEGGLTFWTGNHPLSPGEGDLAANPAIKRESTRLRAGHPGLTEEELEPIYYREAVRAIAADPAWWAGLLVRKALFAVVPAGPSYTLHSRLYRAGSVVPYLVVLPLGLAGLAWTRRRGTWPRAQVLLALSYVLVCVVFLPQERFRLSGLDPTLVVGASAWWALRRRATDRPEPGHQR
jgi:4-amino-4-deoxy-L-arabinose transferase-like glycosyltransferase